MSEKLCVFCKHLKFTQAVDSQGSASFGGEEAKIGCSKGHWEVDTYASEMIDFRQQILRAENCPDYKQANP